MSIERQGRSLVARLGPRRIPLGMVPYGGSVFAVPGADGALEPAARFTVRGSQVRTVEFAALQAPGQEVLRR